MLSIWPALKFAYQLKSDINCD